MGRQRSAMSAPRIHQRKERDGIGLAQAVGLGAVSLRSPRQDLSDSVPPRTFSMGLSRQAVRDSLQVRMAQRQGWPGSGAGGAPGGGGGGTRPPGAAAPGAGGGG